jgi:hypothetical protein
MAPAFILRQPRYEAYTQKCRYSILPLFTNRFAKVMVSCDALRSAPAASAMAVHDRVSFTCDHTAF